MALLDPQGRLGAVTWRLRHQLAALARRVPEFDLVVRSGRRSCREQYDLHGIGRRYNLGSPPVTYARGCQSWHVSGRAVDLNLRIAGTQQDAGSCQNYAQLGQLWEALGGRWGGRFGGFGECGDAGHFEYHPGLEVSDVCPNPDLCDQVAAEVDTLTVAPWYYRVPWIPLAAGASAGAALAVSSGWLLQR